MADTYYAWSRFKAEVNEWGQVLKWIEVGDTVDQGQIKATDEDWASMIETGAVRTVKYPDVAPGQAPAEYFKEQLAKVASGEISVEDAATVPEVKSVDKKTLEANTGKTSK